ncbi:uncharacterized protein RAG0_10808 [Rhynchosporium agropyri]|uniref:2EXR domain-containing protein n=1 Tax=Rhynchosporium agropyri TaxID=914238 RepID=A0A1E1L1B7_9HELO|nr:uncharacterized protein RAG0_10808 [Rhynchosporium agropyri]
MSVSSTKELGDLAIVEVTSAALSLTDSQNTPDVPSFPILPSELRTEIWKLALPGPREIMVNNHGAGRAEDKPVLGEGATAIQLRCCIRTKNQDISLAKYIQHTPGSGKALPSTSIQELTFSISTALHFCLPTSSSIPNYQGRSSSTSLALAITAVGGQAATGMTLEDIRVAVRYEKQLLEAWTKENFGHLETLPVATIDAGEFGLI